MARVTGNRNAHLDHLENEVTEVTALLRDNVEKVLERGEKIDSLQSRSDDLEFSSSNFKTSAVKIRKKLWWRNCRIAFILGVVTFLVITLIITIIIVEMKPWEYPGSHDRHNGTGSMTSSEQFRHRDVISWQ